MCLYITSLGLCNLNYTLLNCDFISFFVWGRIFQVRDVHHDRVVSTCLLVCITIDGIFRNGKCEVNLCIFTLLNLANFVCTMFVILVLLYTSRKCLLLTYVHDNLGRCMFSRHRMLLDITTF